MRSSQIRPVLVFSIVWILAVTAFPGFAQIMTEHNTVRTSYLFPGADSLPVYGYKVINEYPHDSNAFTQGLIYEHGALYESTGLYGSSSLRKVELETGTVLKIYNLDDSYFGEGITMWNNTLIQLTWLSHIGFVYIELETFQPVDSFSYSTQGWGLTHDDTCLIMSDGSSRLHYLDPQTYAEVGYVDVQADGIPVLNLNELEYAQGKIYANVWGSDSIALIEPGTGDVTEWLDLSGIMTDQHLSFQQGVLNGIAYDSENVRLFVTGKSWPALFEIEVDPMNYPPEIISSNPPSPCYIIPDSVLLLDVLARDPDPEDSLFYIWSVNGVVDTSAHDTCYLYSSSTATTDTVVVNIDDGMFYDSSTWVVIVSNPVNENLFSISANPSGSVSVFHIVLCESCDVGLQLFDISGRMISTVFTGELPAGTHSLCSGELISGIYIARLSLNGIILTLRFTVLKK